eukprot:TRINITY_DN15813_c0_g1_i1.p1 TRINITY_DN15813_c0_g1~~TRINITY_DN15813_c0_g1_i1.p1  ORF type:complete len:185 (-),score=22.79 TRINITY_DN15813_c0_g1_i1:148-702(-)
MVLRCKVAVVGDATVGKSALIQMFHSQCTNFPKNYLMTMGVDLCVKELAIEETQNVVELYTFDISGQDIYARLIDQYLENTNWFICVYDITNKESFDNCKRWIDLCRKQRKTMKGVLVANKVDMDDRSMVTETQGLTFAKKHNLEWFPVSALRGTDVDAPFVHVATSFHKDYEEKIKTLQQGVK